MYSEAVIAERQARLEEQFRSLLPEGLDRRPVPECHARRQALEALWDPEEQEPRRLFSQDEEAFVFQLNRKLKGFLEEILFVCRS